MLDEYLRQLNSRAPLTPTEERDLWRAYKETGDPDARYRLIEGYQVLVVRIALALGAKAESAMDLIQEGTVGLIEAVEAFDPGRGVPFPSFAQHRIRGRMLDYFGRQRAVATELPFEETGWAELVSVAVPAGAESDPAACAETSEVRHRLRRAVARLPRQEQRVVSAVFLEDREPQRVAEEMAISPSYLHRLEKRAIRRLRGMLARVAGEFRNRM
ncbi:MAG TPA: sigma-70 family RNA polymerase sigma factor [Firmicutes bacterium]|nr:sigma-70 family RNA polymerase sigma factor [Bacillota bacterium]